MTYRISRRHFLISTSAAAAFLAGPAEAGAPTTSLRPKARGTDFRKKIQDSADVLISQAKLGGVVGFAVADMASGTVLEEHKAQRGLPPASVAKALTACFALDVLGPGHRFVTRVLATGAIVNGVVQGDLILAGGGDPTLDTDGLADLAAQVSAAGVKGVTGAFKVWDGAVPHLDQIDKSQPDHVGYNPALSGLNLNYNRVHFEWRRANGDYTVTMEARTARYRPKVQMAKMSVAPRSLPIYTYEDRNGRDQWSVARNALGDGGARWLPVRKPALYAGDVFRSMALGQGIRLDAPQVIQRLPVEALELATRTSAPLRVILRDMLKYSTNLTAELVGLAATTRQTGRAPTSLRGSAQVMNAWGRQKLGLGSMKLVDHSGLGDASRINARDMALGLRQLRQQMGIKPLLKTFPMRDAKRNVIKDHPIEVYAKTGTLNFVSGLAGFVDLPDGTELVFATFAADMDRRGKLSKQEREKPKGGRAWNRRAKTLQQALIERWGVVYGS